MNISRIVRLLVLGGALVTFGIVIFVVLALPIDQVAHLRQSGEAIQPFAVSLGAVIAALGGFNLIEDWLKRRLDKDEKIASWRNQYPNNKLGLKSGFEFIKKANSDHVYVHDLKKKLKRHVANLETLRTIWFPDPPVRTVDSDEFESIKKIADSIDIKTS